MIFEEPSVSLLAPGSNDSVICYELKIVHPNIASIFPENICNYEVETNENGTKKYIEFNVTGQFLGYTNACVSVVDPNNNNKSETMDCMDMSVIRKPSFLDSAFTASVALLVSLIYINMGAALNIGTIKETLRRPYGPVIGLFSQFVVMPVVSSIIFLLRSDKKPEM
jgi:sodium/bile acid cotransporter 3/5